MDNVKVPATLEGPFKMSGYDHLALVQPHLAEFPDGTTIPLPPGTKLHRIGTSGPMLAMQTGKVESTVGNWPMLAIDA